MSFHRTPRVATSNLKKAYSSYRLDKITGRQKSCKIKTVLLNLNICFPNYLYYRTLRTSHKKIFCGVHFQELLDHLVGYMNLGYKREVYVGTWVSAIKRRCLKKGRLFLVRWLFGYSSEIGMSAVLSINENKRKLFHWKMGRLTFIRKPRWA